MQRNSASGMRGKRVLDFYNPGSPFILISIFLVVFGVYVLSPVTTNTDSRWTIHIAASMIREGNTTLDEYRSLIDVKDDYRIREVNGHLYSYYPIATPMLAVPFVWIGNQIFSWRNSVDLYTFLSKTPPYQSKNSPPNEFIPNFEKLIASFYAAAGCVIIYLIARQFVNHFRSLIITFIFAFSTSMWSTSSRALWQHGPTVLVLSLAIYLVLLARKNVFLITPVGFILAIAYLIRPTNSISLFFISLYVFINHRKYLPLYLLGAVIVFIPFFTDNWLIYHNLLPPYSYQLFQRQMTINSFLEALAGTLISPARGLFIYTSIFLFSIYGFAIQARRGLLSWRNIDPYLAVIIVSHWLTISLFRDWDGGWSLGPRYFTDMTPYFTYFLIPVIEKGIKVFSRSVLKYVFLATFLLSTLIQLRCSTSIYPFMWHITPTIPSGATYRDWDWSDLQILRGFCKEDLLEGKAPACWFK
jgi:hypothetical protein